MLGHAVRTKYPAAVHPARGGCVKTCKHVIAGVLTPNNDPGHSSPIMSIGTPRTQRAEKDSGSNCACVRVWCVTLAPGWRQTMRCRPGSVRFADDRAAPGPATVVLLPGQQRTRPKTRAGSFGRGCARPSSVLVMPPSRDPLHCVRIGRAASRPAAWEGGGRADRRQRGYVRCYLGERNSCSDVPGGNLARGYAFARTRRGG
jgi:hypothetical protein